MGRHAVATPASSKIDFLTRRARGSIALPAVAGTLAFLLYAAYWGRSFAYDEANTVGNFVRPGGFLVPFREQAAFNNHPLFSETLVALSRVTGAREYWMRLPAITFGALTVGVFAWWAFRRYGALAASAGAIVVATSPLFVLEARQARGYSLTVLALLVASIILVDERDSRRARAGYVAAVAIATGTHLYALLTVLGHVGFVVGGPRSGRRRLIDITLGVVLGSLVYSAMVRGMVDHARENGREPRPSFASHVVWDLLGRNAVSVAALVIVIALGALALLRKRAVLFALLVPFVAVLVIWKVVAPTDLYPRFLVASVLPLGAGVAYSVSRRAWLFALVLVAGASSLLAIRSDLSAQPTVREAAGVVAETRALHLRPCAIGPLPLAAYLDVPVERFASMAQVTECDVVVKVGTFGGDLIARASGAYPYQWLYAGEEPLVSRVPRTVLDQSSAKLR